MGLFKSKGEKKIEREIEIRKGINAIKRNVHDLHKHEKSYIDKAKRCKKIADKEQFEFLKRALKKTAAARRLRERQLLSLETAMQIKNQAESDVDFARAMQSVSKSIGELYGSTDMVKTQKQFEKALLQAETLSQQMDLFLDMTTEHVFSGESETDDAGLMSDQEIDQLLDDEVTHEEKTSLDKEIEKGLSDLESEFGKQ